MPFIQDGPATIDPTTAEEQEVTVLATGVRDGVESDPNLAQAIELTASTEGADTVTTGSVGAGIAQVAAITQMKVQQNLVAEGMDEAQAGAIAEVVANYVRGQGSDEEMKIEVGELQEGAQEAFEAAVELLGGEQELQEVLQHSLEQAVDLDIAIDGRQDVEDQVGILAGNRAEEDLIGIARGAAGGLRDMVASGELDAEAAAAARQQLEQQAAQDGRELELLMREHISNEIGNNDGQSFTEFLDAKQAAGDITEEQQASLSRAADKLGDLDDYVAGAEVRARQELPELKRMSRLSVDAAMAAAVVQEEELSALGKVEAHLEDGLSNGNTPEAVASHKAFLAMMNEPIEGMSLGGGDAQGLYGEVAYDEAGVQNQARDNFMGAMSGYFDWIEVGAMDAEGQASWQAQNPGVDINNPQSFTNVPLTGVNGPAVPDQLQRPAGYGTQPSEVEVDDVQDQLEELMAQGVLGG